MTKILDTAHWEVARDANDCREYCRKTETRVEGPWEVGTFVAAEEKRQVWKEIRELIRNGATDFELLESHPTQVAIYHRGIGVIRNLVAPDRDWKTTVIFIYGPPGTGKSRWVRDNYDDVYWKQPQSDWWDGYINQKTVALDDFYGWLPLTTLLRLCDRYPLLVQTKGGQAKFQARQLIITSNTLPKQWYRKTFEEHPQYYGALLRRIDEFKYARSNLYGEWTCATNEEIAPAMALAELDQPGQDGNRFGVDAAPELYSPRH